VSLSEHQLDRYARHIILKEIGGAGQLSLLSAKATLIGGGGIGSPAVQYLAAAGFGIVRLIDDDQVSLSNLQRQTLFGTQDVGRAKVAVAAAAAARLNPDVEFVPMCVRIGAANAEQLLAGSDVVIDGSDNFETRLIVSDAATRLRIPLVSAAVGQFEGQLGVYRGWEADKPCYRCLVGDDPERSEESCSEQGALGAMAGVMGSLAAMEAIRIVTGFGENAAGKLLRVDALTLRFRTVQVAKDPGCPACAG